MLVQTNAQENEALLTLRRIESVGSLSLMTHSSGYIRHPLHNIRIENCLSTWAYPDAGGEDGETEASDASQSSMASRRVQMYGERLHRYRNRRECFQSQDSIVEVVSSSQPRQSQLL